MPNVGSFLTKTIPCLFPSPSSSQTPQEDKSPLGKSLKHVDNSAPKQDRSLARSQTVNRGLSLYRQQSAGDSPMLENVNGFSHSFTKYCIKYLLCLDGVSFISTNNNAGEAQISVKLATYSCAYYLLCCYIKMEHKDNENEAKQYKRCMQEIGHLLIENGSSQRSVMSFKQRNFSDSLRQLDEKVEQAAKYFRKLFKHDNGPSDKLIMDILEEYRQVYIDKSKISPKQPVRESSTFVRAERVDETDNGGRSIEPAVASCSDIEWMRQLGDRVQTLCQQIEISGRSPLGNAITGSANAQAELSS